MIKNMYWSSRKISVILVVLEGNLNFLDRFLGNLRLSNFIKFRPVRAEILRCGRGQADRHDEANSRFSKL